MLKIGSHVSFSKTGLLNATEEALSYGATSFMVYTGAPQNTRRKPMEDLYIEEGRALMARHGIEDIVVHAPYIINLASYKEDTFELAVNFLREEIKRTAYMGVKYIVLHPGAYTDKDPEYGIARIAEGLNEVLEPHQDVHIALETMAGKGTEIGRNFEELASIIEKVKHNDKLAVCFDTCHTHDAGYDIVGDFDQVMDDFDRLIGLDRLAVFHINDSKNFRGAAKDRHAPLGSGLIGYQAIRNIVHHKAAQGKPIILETPWVGKDKNAVRPMYEAEIALLNNTVEGRLGQAYLEDVERLTHFFKGHDLHPYNTVQTIWSDLQDKKKKKEDAREPMERLYDLVDEHQVFSNLPEEQINHRIIGWLAQAHT
ncbi:deoxyribonuclease IV [Ammoniphilus sp. CFH 90114]|uniref:deoxyribonuclease IV n=1 Tax=Ammoniphilus sp. CFH 90114 TaxID=2493665 RepID=UPI00100F82F0|nr:deoxyribonuclease IV [Ammoniphilus sp. CFH 90114]RXT04149.1 deoxyribonuclease IV [Ammoniphilus sp. CFH 90114]